MEAEELEYLFRKDVLSNDELGLFDSNDTIHRLFTSKTVTIEKKKYTIYVYGFNDGNDPDEKNTMIFVVKEE